MSNVICSSDISKLVSNGWTSHLLFGRIFLNFCLRVQQSKICPLSFWQIRICQNASWHYWQIFWHIVLLKFVQRGTKWTYFRWKTCPKRAQFGRVILFWMFWPKTTLTIFELHCLNELQFLFNFKISTLSVSKSTQT